MSRGCQREKGQSAEVRQSRQACCQPVRGELPSHAMMRRLGSERSRNGPRAHSLQESGAELGAA